MSMLKAIRNDKGQLVKITGYSKPIPAHLKSLRIPPAWTDVYVDTNPNAKQWVSGFDAAGRPQRLYSSLHTLTAKTEKFGRVGQLIAQADQIKAQIELDVRLNSKSRRIEVREEAVVAYLIFETGIRPGSSKETLAAKKAYGATTLRAQHVKVMSSGRVWLDFTGKKGVRIKLRVTNPWLCEELIRRKNAAGTAYSTPLFETSDAALRKYVRTLGDGSFMPKDFRTMLGTKLAAELFDRKRLPANKTAFNRWVREVFKQVAAALGNTPAICRSAYVEPSIVPVFAE